MRKIFYILFILISIKQGFAQSHIITKNVLGWGFDVGYNASTLYNANKGSKFPMRFNHAVHAGAIATTTMQLVNVEFGLFYSEKGGTGKINPSDEFVIYKLSYIEIPINMTIKIPIPSYSIKPFDFYPYLGINAGVLIKGTGYPMINDAAINLNVTKQLNRFDIGLNAGVGLEISGFNIRLGCTAGILPVLGSGAEKYRNLLFSASIGYIFY